MSDDQKKSKFIQNMQAAPYLKDEAVNFIFNNLRNVSLSLLPLVAAKAYLQNPQGDPAILVRITVIALSIVALMLLGLNILHGWRRLSELNIRRWALIPAAILYGFGIALFWAILMDKQL